MSAHRDPDERHARWAEFVDEARRDPDLPFDRHLSRFAAIFADPGPRDGPPQVWRPPPAEVARSNLGRFMAGLGCDSYEALHAWSVEQRAAFWDKVIERLGIVFAKKPESILALDAGVRQPRWLPGAEMNCVDSCFVARPEATAVISGREGSRQLQSTTYAELERLVNRIANGLRDHDFKAEEGIALYMPMTLECVAAYLGIVRAGGRVVSIADSFPATEIRRRLEIAGAAGIVTVERFERSGKTLELYRKVKEAGAPRAIVVPASPGTRPGLRRGDLLWADLLSSADRFRSPTGDPCAVINVLFSSGTTGTPKAIPWNHLTPIKCAMDGCFHQDIRPGEAVAWPTNIGWMMGPWLIFAAMINRATLALYEGAPTGPGFAGFVRDAGVGVLGLVPSLVRAWRSSGALRVADWSAVRVISSTGEPSSREDYLWLMSRTGYRAPVIEYCGGTEIGGGYVTGTVVQPASPATFTTPALGIDLVILDDEGRPVAEGEAGEAYLVPPSIGLSQSLLERDHDEIYYDGCPRGPGGEELRRHGDRLARLHGGFYRAQGRADDTMNLGGVKVSSMELERVLDGHEAVYEAAAVGVQPEGEGAEQLVVFVVQAKSIDPERLRHELGARLALELNPLFKIHDLQVVDRLPRTASNKLMRRALRSGYQDRVDRA